MLLIVAQSARMLALQAYYAGVSCVALDCFSDFDTQGYCVAVHRLESLALTDVQAGLQRFQQCHHTIEACVYGSGLESYPETLQYLSRQFRLIGNPPAVFASTFPHPESFLRWDQWQIPYPDVCFSAPPDTENWLVKPLYGNGGTGIVRYSDTVTTDTSVFWQRERKGIAASVLFCADGMNFKIIGFNRQFNTVIEDRPFVFSGLITWPVIDPLIQTRVTDWLNDLVPGLGLRGINGLDFLVQDDSCYLLEINPRPPASLALYGSDGWLWHEAGVLQRGWPEIHPQALWSGLRIIYAQRDVLIQQDLTWPLEASDIPMSGVWIRKGQPICSIMSHQTTEAQVLNDLDRLEQSIFQLFL
jgi:predicted ATP-grasp superfamily ATP-dependent carboligase